MYLYRIEPYCEKRLEELIQFGVSPKIPSDKIRLLNEEANTKRICVSQLLNGCLSALGESILEYWALKQYSNPVFVHNIQLKIIVMRFNTEGINNQEYISSNTLFKKKYVFDAKATKEYWMLQHTMPEHIYIRNLCAYQQVNTKILGKAEEKGTNYIVRVFQNSKKG